MSFARPTPEEKYQQAVAFPGARLEVLPLRSKVLPGFIQKVPVLFQIVTGTVPEDQAELNKRTPFHLCVVLDISGSMAGSKLEACKSAIRQLLHACAEDDVVSLVVYECQARALFTGVRVGDRGDTEEENARERMIRVVDGIRPGGGTNLWDGLQMGYDILTREEEEENFQVVNEPEGEVESPGVDSERGDVEIPDPTTGPPAFAKHLFVLSDGEVNQGPITDTTGILEAVGRWEEKIPILSYGIGRDFNERLMTPLGKVHKGGHYFYLTDQASIERLIARGVKSLTGVVARDVHVGVMPLGAGNDEELQYTGDLFFPESAVEGWSFERLRETSVTQWVSEVEVRPRPGVDQQVAFEWAIEGHPLVQEARGVVRIEVAERSGRGPSIQSLRPAPVNEEVQSFLDTKRACELRNTACAEGGQQARAQVEQALDILEARIKLSDRFGFAEEYAAKTRAILDDRSLWRADGGATEAAAKHLGYYTHNDVVEEEEEEMDFDLFD